MTHNDKLYDYNFGDRIYEIQYCNPLFQQDYMNGCIKLDTAIGQIENFNPPNEVVLWNKEKQEMNIINYRWIIIMRPKNN